MPSTPEIDARLAAAASAKKHGGAQAFGKPLAMKTSVNTTSNFPGDPQALSKARNLADTEMLFGQQAIALEANLRAMLATLRALQTARMRVYGADDSDLADLEQAERTFGQQAVALTQDGFVSPPPRHDGGSDGNVSR